MSNVVFMQIFAVNNRVAIRAVLGMCVLGICLAGCAKQKIDKNTAARPGPLVSDEERFGPDSPMHSIKTVSR